MAEIYTPNMLDKEFNDFTAKANCYAVTSFPFSERCEFVKKASNCLTGTNIVPYMHLLACDFKCKNQFEEHVFVAFLSIVCFELLLCLGYVVHFYYSPALKAVSRMLHMSEHLAGVTILAFGNTTTDLFCSLTTLNDDSAVLANSLANSLFVVMFIGGLVCYVSPFKMSSYSTIRDLLFFIFGLVLLDYMLNTDERVDFLECILLTIVYFIYLAVCVIDVYLVRITLKSLNRQIRDLEEIEEMEDLDDTHEIVIKRKLLTSRYDALAEDDRVDILERRTTWRPLEKGRTFTYMTRRSVRRQAVDIPANRFKYRGTGNRNHNLFREFFVALNPIPLADWRHAGMLTRIFYIAVAPVTLICTIYIPLVDFELQKNGWSKLLNCIHIFLNPAITLIMGKAMLFRDKSQLWYYNIQEAFMYGVYSLVITVPLAIFVMIHSSTRCPPTYHWIYMIMNLTGSMFMTFQCATEISLIMNMISSIYKVPTDFMSVTILPIATALSQLVASVSLALQGYEKMAYAATIGRAYLNVMMNTNIEFFTKRLIGRNLTYENVSGTYGENAYILLILGLATTVLWTLILNFNSRRSVGIFSMSVYVLFLIFAILIKSGTIHSYNTDVFLADSRKS